MSTFAQRLKQARAIRNVGKARLGLAAGLSRNAVYALERDEGGGNPTLGTIESLAKALDVDVAWLATGDGPAPKAPGKRRAA